MQLQTPIVSMIANGTWCINEYGMAAMFLLEGADKALLIDTGIGTFDVKKLCESLTEKELIVACTHGHVDHVGGNGFFNRVYMNEADFQAAETLTVEARRDFFRAVIGMSNGLFAVTENDIKHFSRLPELCPLCEGDVIDLGGRRIVVYETPGHTPGSISFLDVRERILFSGDACNINTLLSFIGIVKPRSGVDTLLATAKKLHSLEPYYDRNYNGHIGYAADLTCVPHRYSVNRDAISLCSDILAGKVVGERQSIFGADSYYAVRGAFGVRYDPDQIWERKEQK